MPSIGDDNDDVKGNADDVVDSLVANAVIAAEDEDEEVVYNVDVVDSMFTTKCVSPSATSEI